MKDFIRLIKYAKPYWKFILLNFLSNSIYVIFSLISLTMVSPFLAILFEKVNLIVVEPEFSFRLSALINYFYFIISTFIIEQGKYEALIFVSSIFVVFSLISNLFRYLGMYFMAPLRNGVVEDIRNEVYKKILILPLSFYSKVRAGDIISRLTTDVHEIEWSIMSTMQLILREPLLIIVYFSSLLVISPLLTLFTAIVLPLSGLIISLVGKNIKKKSEISQNKLGSITSSFDETISGLKIIKGFNAIDYAEKRFEKLNTSFTLYMNKIFRRTELASPLTEILGVISLLTIVYFGGKLVLGGGDMLTADALILYVVIFARMISPAKSFITATYSIQKGMASGKRVFEIMDAQEKIIEIDNPLEKKSLESKIEFKDVGFQYEDVAVLKNINLCIEKGKTVALVGPSGAGKSTIADLLPRFYDVTQGEICIDEINIKSYTIRDLRGLMGIVGQEVVLFNDSIANNISFGILNVQKEDIIEAAKIAQIHEFIDGLPEKYDTFVGDLGSLLSGGQKQRLSIARAVLHNPDILILDEATSALDSESEYLVQQALNILMQNRTTLVIAHRLSTIQQADLIIVLREGRIVEQGNHHELLDLKGVYYNMIQIQNFS
ncbi:MAG: ATP-binding cassette domain-containing protein [Bacteroidales bacterium]|nr:ATP-binding cassette domain-containing protein [Bacteroidales bacterium]